ncbi:MAG: hypothetical protein JJ895_02940 [Balneolaceae bacterium]|nr:hypothetical protein [Balneolaceae bacterium]
MKRVVLFSFLILTFGLVENLQAQSHEEGVPYQMGLITLQMVDQLNDIPANVRRVAVYKMNYNAMRFTVQEVEFIRSEIESSLRTYAGITVLSPPELEPNDKMKIMGNDSTLQILNIQGRSLADVSPEFLAEVTEKYGVNGLIEVGLQRRNPDGLILSVRMMNPRSREIVWAKSFIANPFEVVEQVDKGQTLILAFGAGSMQTDSKFRADTSFANQDTSITTPVLNYAANFTYRQPLNRENSAYIGFTGGVNILRARRADEFNLFLLNFGLTYYQALSPEKNEDIDSYRMVVYLNTSVQLPLSNTKGEMFTARPGIMFNMSKNLGLSFYTSLILSGEELRLSNNDRITYNKVGYGVHAVVRF